MVRVTSLPAGTGTEALGDFSSADRRMLGLLPLAAIIGAAAALIAVALLGLIGLFTNLFYYGRFSVTFASPAGNELGLLAIAVPIAGGLVVGLLARFGSERIRGHGIPEALEAILINRSKIEPRVTVLKPVATAVSIGSGGPFGAEGPIIMTGGSLGSLLGQLARISASERKTLLVAGAAAGMAATFNTPLAAVLLAVELLLFEWKPRSLLPVGVAVVVATLLRWPLLGRGPLFPIPESPLPDASLLGVALLVGALAGGLSILLTRSVYASEDAFRKLPVHWMWWPAIGGLAIGIGGIIEPRALGVGYNSIDALLLGELALSVVVVLLLVKAAIWAIALGSGTSGGVLAPLLLIGGSMGALLAGAVPGSPSGLLVLIAMGAMIGGTMRSPFTGAVFCVELTHDVNAIFPLLAAALVADGITILALKRSILTEKVARRGVHVAREYAVDPLEQVPVRMVMRSGVRMIAADLSVDEATRVASADHAGEAGLSLVSEGREVGFVARGDLQRFLELGGDPSTPVVHRAVVISTATYPEEPMRCAAQRLAELDGSALPVVDRGEPGHVVGFVTRESPFDARVWWEETEQRRERALELPRGWVGGLRRLVRRFGMLPPTEDPERDP